MNWWVEGLDHVLAVTDGVRVPLSGADSTNLTALHHPPPAKKKLQQRVRASKALEEVREEERAPAPKFQPFLQQDPPPQSFGSSMVQSMTWGEFAPHPG